MRSRIAGSAWSRSQVGVSMMWASASCTTSPVELYAMPAIMPEASTTFAADCKAAAPASAGQGGEVTPDLAYPVVAWPFG